MTTARLEPSKTHADFRERNFATGDRVRMRYGFGTIVDEPGEDLFGVVADVGGYWLVDVAELELAELRLVEELDR